LLHIFYLILLFVDVIVFLIFILLTYIFYIMYRYLSNIIVLFVALGFRVADGMSGLSGLAMPAPIAATRMSREIPTSSIPAQLSKRTAGLPDMRQKFEKVVRTAQVGSESLF
jgi:hypothetical protein